MNLPEMLRQPETRVPLGHTDEFGYDEFAYVGPELAALVEAADAMVSPDATNPRHVAYANTRAALVAKIGGKGMSICQHCHQMGEYVACLKAEVDVLRASLAAAEADAVEQARLVGMGSEREAALLAKLETIEATATANARDYWQAKLADEERHADELAEALSEQVEFRGLKPTAHKLVAAHAARRAARDGQEETR